MNQNTRLMGTNNVNSIFSLLVMLKEMTKILCSTINFVFQFAYLTAAIFSLHCTPASCGAVYCNRSCLWVCDSGRAGRHRTLLHTVRAQCLRLSEHFFH